MYPCRRCGCCCRQVGHVFWGKTMARADGSCKYWDRNTHLCQIYESRPLFCRIDETYDKYLKDKMSREEFYRKNQEMCRQLQKKAAGSMMKDR